MQAISIKPYIGLGDALQFSSLPENYFRATGKKLIDINKPWFFDYNPYVERNPAIIPDKITEMWNFPRSPASYEYPNPRRPQDPKVYMCNAEIWAGVLGVPCVLNRPRLYRFEDYPFEERKMILLQTMGRSHGPLPQEIVDHVIQKYGPTGQLHLIGGSDNPDVPGIPRINTPTFWDLAEVISKARMVIAPDSGPAWVASCFPDVIVKKIRTKPHLDVFETWVPLCIDNIHSHWDDRCQQIYCISADKDVGFTSSWKKI